MKRLRFSFGYFFFTLILLVAEYFIATKMHDSLIRPFGGDFLVVILIYCIVKSFFDTPVLPTAVWVLALAYGIEISQYFHLVNLLHLENTHWPKILLGTTFSFYDLLAYTLGIICVLIVEQLKISLTKF